MSSPDVSHEMAIDSVATGEMNSHRARDSSTVSQQSPASSNAPKTSKHTSKVKVAETELRYLLDSNLSDVSFSGSRKAVMAAREEERRAKEAKEAERLAIQVAARKQRLAGAIAQRTQTVNKKKEGNLTSKAGADSEQVSPGEAGPAEKKAKLASGKGKGKSSTLAARVETTHALSSDTPGTLEAFNTVDPTTDDSAFIPYAWHKKTKAQTKEQPLLEKTLTNSARLNSGAAVSKGKSATAKGGRGSKGAKGGKIANGSGRQSPAPSTAVDASGALTAGDVTAGTARAVAQLHTQAHAADNVEEEVDDRLYCICQTLYDPDRLMIACDRCDNWYHTECLGIEEKAVTLIDRFYCPSCQAETHEKITYKPKCRREDCVEAAIALSKFCSDWCGLAVAAGKLDLHKNEFDIPQLYDKIQYIKKPEAVTVVLDGSESAAGKDNESSVPGLPDNAHELVMLETALQKIIDRRNNVESAIKLASDRIAYLHIARQRSDAACRRHASMAHAGVTVSSKSKKSRSAGAAAQNADAPCGFDVHLVWNDAQFKEFLINPIGWPAMQTKISSAAADIGANNDDDPAVYDRLLDLQDDEEEAEEGVRCMLPRRKCDRHSGWAKLREADFEAERSVLNRRLDALTGNERRTRRRIEDAQELLRKSAMAATKKPGVNADLHHDADGMQVDESIEVNIVDLGTLTQT